MLKQIDGSGETITLHRDDVEGPEEHSLCIQFHILQCVLCPQSSLCSFPAVTVNAERYSGRDWPV